MKRSAVPAALALLAALRGVAPHHPRWPTCRSPHRHPHSADTDSSGSCRHPRRGPEPEGQDRHRSHVETRAARLEGEAQVGSRFRPAGRVIAQKPARARPSRQYRRDHRLQRLEEGPVQRSPGLLQLIQLKRRGSGEAVPAAEERRQVTGGGVVDKILADDNDGGRHQRFILRLGSGQTLLVAHNIDIAPRLPSLAAGDSGRVQGRLRVELSGRRGALDPSRPRRSARDRLAQVQRLHLQVMVGLHARRPSPHAARLEQMRGPRTLPGASLRHFCRVAG